MPENSIEIRLGLELRGIRGDLRRMRSEFNQAFSGIRRSSLSLGRALAGVFSGLSAAAGIHSIVRIGVEMDSLRRRLKAVSRDQHDFSSSLRFVRSEANRLGQDFQQLLRSYIDFKAATDAANLGIDQSREIFSAFSETISVLGLSSEEAGRIFLALRQMVSGGVLQMQDLNQIAESLPGAFDVFAKAMGVSVQELRQLTSEARINATPALLRVSRVLRERFGRNVADSANSARAAFNRLSTAWQRFADAIATSGALDALVDSVNRLRELLSDQGVINSVKKFTHTLIDGFSAAVKHGTTLVKVLVLLKAAAAGLRIGRSFGPLGGLVGGLAGTGSGLAALKEVDALLKSWRKETAGAANDTSGYVDQVAKLRDQYKLATEYLKQWGAAYADARKKGNEALQNTIKKEIDRWAFIAQEARKQLDLLAKRSAPEVLPAVPKGKPKPPHPVIVDKPGKEIDVGRIRKELRQIDAEILRLQGRTVEATRAALETQFAGLVEKLRKIGDRAGLAKVEKLIDMSVARAQLASLTEDYSKFRDRVGRALDQVNQKVQLGILSQREGQAQLTRLYEDAIDKMRQYRVQAAKLPGSKAFIGELRSAVLETQVQLRQIKSQFGQFFMGITDDVRNALSSLFQGLIDGNKSIKQSLIDFARGLAESIQRRLSERAADALTKALLGDSTKKAFDQLLNQATSTFERMGQSLTSILSSAVSGIGSILRNLFSSLGNSLGSSYVSTYHDGRGFSGKRIGGPVLGAPRLHRGLMPDEFLAVLQKGEVVLPKNLVKNMPKKDAGGNHIVVNNSFIISSPTDRSSQEQIAAKAGLAISRAIRRME